MLAFSLYTSRPPKRRREHHLDVGSGAFASDSPSLRRDKLALRPHSRAAGRSRGGGSAGEIGEQMRDDLNSGSRAMLSPRACQSSIGALCPPLLCSSASLRPVCACASLAEPAESWGVCREARVFGGLNKGPQRPGVDLQDTTTISWRPLQSPGSQEMSQARLLTV